MKYKKKFKSITVLGLSMVILVACNAPKVKESNESELKVLEKETVYSKFQSLEKEYGATLGVYAIDTKNSNTITYNEKNRFAYASTIKAISSGLLLNNITFEDTDKKIFFTEDELVTYSPVTEKNVNDGMTLKEIMNAAVAYSDNTAGNIIMKELNCPSGFQNELKNIGDNVTQANRYEPELNDFKFESKYDTSTPEAIGKDLEYLLKDGNLPPKNLEFFKKIMINNTTGDKLIRESVPGGYKVGDKTGAASYGTRNDIAFIIPESEGNQPLIWVVFSNMKDAKAEYDDKLISDTALVLSEYFSLK